MAKDLEVALRLRIEGNNVVVAGLDGVDKKLAGLKQGGLDVGAAFKSAFMGLLPAISAATIIKFLTDCVKEAQEAEKVFIRLRAELEKQGFTFENVSKEIDYYSRKIERISTFSRDTFIRVLTNLTQKTGDYKGSLALVTGAVGIANKYDKELNETVNLLYESSVGGARGLVALQKELGGAALQAQSATEAVKNLIKENENVEKKGLTVQWNKFGSAFKENVMKPIGDFAGTKLTNFLTTLNNIGFVWGILTKKQKEAIGVTKEEDNALTALLKKLEDAQKAREAEANAVKKAEEAKREIAEKGEAELKILTDSEEAQRQLDLAADKKYLDDKAAADAAYWQKRGEQYAAFLEIGKGFAEAEKTLMEDLFAGNEDAWKNYYKRIIDLAFKAYEDKLAIDLAAAFASAWIDPTKWGAVIALSAQMAGVEALKGVLKLPAMAEGGIVKARSGGTIIRAGEAGQDEAIIPLNKGMGRPVNITINGYVSTEMVQELYRKMKQLENTGGV